MNASYQFAPIRTYSGAKSNKKTKAITEFVKQLFDRHYFDRTYTNRDAIVKAVQKECDILERDDMTMEEMEADQREKQWKVTIHFYDEREPQVREVWGYHEDIVACPRPY